MLEQATNLRGIVMNRIYGDMIDEPVMRGKDSSAFGILLVDEFSAKLLSKYCTMTDLLNRGVFSVESIYQVRQNFQLYQGLYFISPTIKSCEALAKDYEDKKNYRYKKIHIFFTHKASEECLKALVNEGVINRTVTCSEFNLSFFPVNKNGFDLQLESGLKIFKCDDTTRSKILDVMSKRLLTVCASLKCLPIVQYQKSSPMCCKLAELMDALIQELPIKAKREGILLLTDRTIDLVSPCLHDYNYEAMTYDLFDINDGKLEINGKKIELKEKDELWDSYRGLHIAQAFDKLTKDLDEFKKSDLSKAGDTSNLDSFEGMASALTGMSAYKTKTSQFSGQITIASEINKLYKDNHIYEMIELEQDIVSGENNGKKINTRDIFKNFTILKSKLEKQRPDLLRLLVVLYISMQITEKDFNVLCGKLNPEEQTLFYNLKNCFGIDEKSQGAKGKGKPNIARDKISNLNSGVNESMSFSSLRASPQMEILVEGASNFSLDLNEYPLMNWDKPLPKVEKKYGTKNLFAGGNDNADDLEDMQQMIYFNIGGIARNEIAALEKMQNNNVLNHKLCFGSTGVYNAKEYIKQIQNMSQDMNEELAKDAFEASGKGDAALNVAD
ncbi:MAG: Sec1 family protein [archaeon]|nr:Sec1 family protein [archaeon]